MHLDHSISGGAKESFAEGCIWHRGGHRPHNGDLTLAPHRRRPMIATRFPARLAEGRRLDGPNTVVNRTSASPNMPIRPLSSPDAGGSGGSVMGVDVIQDR